MQTSAENGRLRRYNLPSLTKILLTASVLALAVVGCARSRPVYLNRPVARVVVLPPFVETMNAEAWKTMWPHLLEGLKQRGYAVVSRGDVEAFYAKNRFHGDPAEIKLYK